MDLTIGLRPRFRASRHMVAVGLASALVACAFGSSPFPPTSAPGASGPRLSSNEEMCTLDGVRLEVISVANADPFEVHVRFELTDSPRLWEPAEPDSIIWRFRDAVRHRLGADADIDAWSLLRRQRAIFETMPEAWRGEAINSTLLLERRVGTVAAVGCLEAMLWKWQAARYPMIEHPTEFGAFVLRRLGRVRVYLSSADLVGQRIRSDVAQRVQADRRDGFHVTAHIHNHPFLFDRVVGDRMWTLEGTQDDVAGALAPSMTDVQFYRRLRESLDLQQAWVTNGLETARFLAIEFDSLTAR